MKEFEFLDFEIFYKDRYHNKKSDGEQYAKNLAEDKEWARSALKNKYLTPESSRKEWFKKWVAFHRKNQLSVGKQFYFALTCINLIAAGVGALLGFQAIKLCLSDSLINVSALLSVGVIVPFFCCLLAYYLLIRLQRNSEKSEVKQKIVSFLWKGIIHWGMKRCPQNIRLAITEIIDSSDIWRRQYGKVLLLSIGMCMRWFGLLYVISLFVGAIFIFAMKERTFTWETTLTNWMTPEVWYEIMQVLTLGISSLTIEDIEQAKQIGGQKGTLQFWASSILLSMFFYSILPYFVLFFSHVFCLSYWRKKINFYELYYEDIYLTFINQSNVDVPSDIQNYSRNFDNSEKSQQITYLKEFNPLLVYVAQTDVARNLQKVSSIIKQDRQYNWKDEVVIGVEKEFGKLNWKEKIAQYLKDTPKKTQRIYFLQSLHQTATVEKIRDIKKLRDEIGNDVGIEILLISMDSISPDNEEDWKVKINNLKDRNIVLTILK